jgi:hypothetical protein
LTLAHHLKRDRLVELKTRPAIERGEGLAFEFELDGKYRAGRFAMDVAAGFGVAADLIDARILKKRAV